VILGVGTDLLDSRRVGRLYERYGVRLVERILNPEERRGLSSPSGRLLAKYFAAKEAVSKACGVGISGKLGFHDMTLERKPKMPPAIHVSKACLQEIWPFVEDPSRITIKASLSDEGCYVQAFVVVAYQQENI
jgi:holo-[acyl-carrier protein] synthase